MEPAPAISPSLEDIPSLSLRGRLLESQNEALQLIISGAPLADIFARLVTAVDHEGEGDSVSSILLVDASSQCLCQGVAPGLPATYNAAINGVPIDPELGTCSAAVARREVVITPDFEAAPGWQKLKHLPLALGLRAAWSMPIVGSSGRVLGTFGTYFRTCRRPTEREMSVVALLTKTAAMAIEQRSTETRLHAAESRTSQQMRLYETVLSNTPDLVYVFDRNHRFTYANDALLAMWGRTAEEAIGKNCLELGYEPWHAEMHSREIETVIATKRPIRGEVAFNGTNGRRFYDYIFAPVLGSDGDVTSIAGTTRDVTEKRQLAADAAFLGDLAQRLAPLSDEGEIIRLAVRAVGQHFRVHRCYFVECKESANVLKVGENWVRDDAPSLAGTYTMRDFGDETWWRQYASGNFAVEDTVTHPLTAGNAANYLGVGVRAYAVQPVRRVGEWTVVLGVTENQPRLWTRDELQLLEHAAARVWPLVERARSEAALRAARDEALAASRAKDDFIATLSHELRTPLNPVLLLATEEARNASLPADTRADFEMIARNVSLEARLIDDLLDLTRITHDKLALDFKEHDVHRLLEEAIGTVRTELAGKPITLTTRFGAPSARVRGDEVRLQQIFWNVLKNAVKFTAVGSITVTTTTSPTRPDHLIIEVTDTGIGLSTEEQATIFQPFVQGSHRQVNSTTYGGLGLGLAICRKIAEAHQGTIAARSPGRNQGTTLVVELPLASAAAPLPIPLPAQIDTPARPVLPTRPRVLLVEDHEPSRIALARLLTTRKAEVTTAGSAEDALKKAATQTFDLVISDIGLPGESGYEMMRTLRTKYGLPGVAISGYGTDADIQRSKEAGFFLHLTKPVKAQLFDQALAAAVRL